MCSGKPSFLRRWRLSLIHIYILAEFFGMESSTETEKTAIMGKAQATASQMAAFCLSKNASPQLPSCTVEERCV